MSSPARAEGYRDDTPAQLRRRKDSTTFLGVGDLFELGVRPAEAGRLPLLVLNGGNSVISRSVPVQPDLVSDASGLQWRHGQSCQCTNHHN